MGGVFLSEGGASGHLNSLTHDAKLSFGKLKKILSLANQGKLEYTEKIDGANIALSWKNGQIIYARNKNDILSGDKNLQSLINREFAGGDDVKKAYIDAFKTFENAIKQLNDNEKEKIFQNGSIFYSAEISGPAFSNVINYDKNILTIHRDGHTRIDRETGEASPFQDEKTAKLLDNMVNNIDQKNSNFAIRRNAVQKLKGLSDGKYLQVAKIKIDKYISDAGLTDANTIEDLYRVGLQKFVHEQLPEISEDIKNFIVENILGNQKFSNLKIKLSKELRSRISKTKKESKKIMERIIFPIEEAVHDYTVELLKGAKSAFILDNNKEIENLRKKTEQAIEAIESSGNKDAIKILTKQLQKLKSIDNISTSVEGFVFNFDGKMYKFTGNFAPINQILNLFNYGRGKNIPSMNKMKEIKEEEKKKIIAVIPGSFKPPHSGHFNMAKYFADMPEIDTVYILISPKERSGHSSNKSSPITAKMSKEIWDVYSKHETKVKAEITEYASPVQAAFEFMKTLNPGDVMVLGQSEKEKSINRNRFNKAQEWADKNNLGIIVKSISTPVFSAGISGTKLRDVIAEENMEEFVKHLPEELPMRDKIRVWSIVSQPQNLMEYIKKKVNEEIQNTLDKKNEQLNYDEVIKETLNLDEGKLRDWWLKLKGGIKEKLKKAYQELKETGAAAKILGKLISGKPVTQEELKELKEQSIDVLRSVGLLGTAIAPGGSVALPLLLKTAKIFNIELLPSSFRENMIKEATEKQRREGGMIAIMVPKEIQEKIKNEGLLGEEGSLSPEELHCTLVYLGNASKLSEEQKNDIKNILKEIISEFTPFNVKLGGFGKFVAGDGGMPYFATVDAPEITSLQTKLNEKISQIIELNSDHGFTPHMTLGYMDKEKDLPNLDSLEGAEWEVNEVSLVFGDKIENYKFNKIEEVSAMSVGAIEGGGVSKRKKKNSLIREMQGYELLQKIFSEEQIENLQKIEKLVGLHIVNWQTIDMYLEIFNWAFKFKKAYEKEEPEQISLASQKLTEVYEKLLNNTKPIFEFVEKNSIDINRLSKWIKTLQDWLGESRDSYAKKLIEYKDILVALNGEPILPNLVFRGLENLEKVPEPEQPILYTTKKSKATSWTKKLEVAKSFCMKAGPTTWKNKYGDAVVLAVTGNDIISHGELFLWPLSMDALNIVKYFNLGAVTLLNEEEYGIWLNKPMPVAGIHYCIENTHKTIDPDVKQRILKRRKPLAEKEADKSFFKKVPQPEESDKKAVIISDEGGSMELDSIKEIKRGKYMIDRDKFLEELQLREYIREGLKIVKKQEKEKILQEEQKLRKYIRKIISEGEDGAPHHNTGINTLENTLKKIIPVLEDAYKSLTTNKEQRDSFKAHIIKAIQNSLAPERMLDQTLNQEISENIDVEIGDEKEEENLDTSNFIDIEKTGKDEPDDFTIPGKDMTGRNIAEQTYQKIEKTIVDAYSMLSDDEDTNSFYEYLLKNMKLYFQRFENELQSNLDMPDIDVPEEEKV